MAYELVETVTVGSGGSSLITFSNLPQTGTDLFVRISGRSTGTSLTHFEIYNPSQSWRRIQGTGSSAQYASGTSYGTMSGLVIPGTDTTSNTFGNAEIIIANYTSTAYKSYCVTAVGEDNNTTAYQTMVSGLIQTTSAITELKIATSANSFAQHSTISLYTIS